MFFKYRLRIPCLNLFVYQLEQKATFKKQIYSSRKTVNYTKYDHKTNTQLYSYILIQLVPNHLKTKMIYFGLFNRCRLQSSRAWNFLIQFNSIQFLEFNSIYTCQSSTPSTCQSSTPSSFQSSTPSSFQNSTPSSCQSSTPSSFQSKLCLVSRVKIHLVLKLKLHLDSGVQLYLVSRVRLHQDSGVQPQNIF